MKNSKGSPKTPTLGQSLTEYLTLLVLVSLVCVVSVQSMGRTIQRKIQQATQAIHQGIVFRDVRTSPRQRSNVRQPAPSVVELDDDE